MAKIPAFAKASSVSKMEAAVTSGVLTYPAFVYVAENKSLYFIDEDSSVNEIGAREVSGGVSIVEQLPETGEPGVLYVCGDLVYTWDEEKEEFVAKYSDVTSKLEEVEGKIADFEERLEDVEEGSAKIIFDTTDDFPVPGKENACYYSKEDGLFYTWNTEENNYQQIVINNEVGVIWIEILDDEEETI